MHQNRASPFASDFLAQTRVSQGILQRGSFLPVFIAEEIAVRLRFSSLRKSRILGPQKSRDLPGGSKNRRRSRRESRDFGALSLKRFLGYVLPNLCFTTRRLSRITKMTKTFQAATKKGLSAGLAEMAETTEMTRTTGIQGAKYRFPKNPGSKHPKTLKNSGYLYARPILKDRNKTNIPKNLFGLFLTSEGYFNVSRYLK